MSAEGNVYLCEVEREDQEYILKLKDNSSITARGLDIKLLKLEICEQIISWNGDGEAILEIIPGSESAPDCRGRALYSEVVFNTKVTLLNKEELFESGYCKKCGYGMGGRTKKSLDVGSKPKGLVCGVDSSRPGIKIYSNKFIEILSDRAKITFNTWPVLCNGQSTNYFELRPDFLLHPVSIKGGEYVTTFHRSWHCTECLREVVTFTHDEYEYGTLFISDLSILEHEHKIIFIDTTKTISLAIRNDVRAELSQIKEAKSLSTCSVVVVSSEYVDTSSPVLPKPEKFDWVL